MLVTKIGSDLAVRLSEEVVQALDLKEGDSVQLTPAGDRSIEIQRISENVVETDPEKRWELIEDLRRMRGWLPDDFKFDREEANER